MAVKLLLFLVVTVYCVVRVKNAAIRDGDVNSQQSSDHWADSTSVTAIDRPDDSEDEACQTILPSYAGGVDILRPSNYIFPPPVIQHDPAYYYSFFLQRSIFFYNWWAPFGYDDRSDWPDKPFPTSSIASSDVDLVFPTAYLSRSFSDPISETYISIQTSPVSNGITTPLMSLSWYSTISLEDSTPPIFSSWYSTISLDYSATDMSYKEASYQKTHDTVQFSTQTLFPTTSPESSLLSRNIWDTGHSFAGSTSTSASIIGHTTHLTDTFGHTGSLSTDDNTHDTTIVTTVSLSDLSRHPSFSMSYASDTLDGSSDILETQTTTESYIVQTRHRPETLGETLYESKDVTLGTSFSVTGTQSEGFTGVGLETTPFSGDQQTITHSNLVSESHNSDGYPESQSSKLWSLSEEISAKASSHVIDSRSFMPSTTKDIFIAQSITSSYSTDEHSITNIRSTSLSDQNTMSWRLQADTTTALETIPLAESFTPWETKSYVSAESLQFSSSGLDTFSVKLDSTGISSDISRHVGDLNSQPSLTDSHIRPTTVISSIDYSSTIENKNSFDSSGTSTDTVTIFSSEVYIESFTTGHDLSNTRMAVRTTLLETSEYDTGHMSTSDLDSVGKSVFESDIKSSYTSFYQTAQTASISNTDVALSISSIETLNSMAYSQYRGSQVSDGNTPSQTLLPMDLSTYFSDSLHSGETYSSNSFPSGTIDTFGTSLKTTGNPLSVVPSLSIGIDSVSGSGLNNPSDTITQYTDILRPITMTKVFSTSSNSLDYSSMPRRTYLSDVGLSTTSSRRSGDTVYSTTVLNSGNTDEPLTRFSTSLDVISTDENQISRPIVEETLIETGHFAATSYTLENTETTSLIQSDTFETTSILLTGTLPSIKPPFLNAITGSAYVYSSGLVDFTTHSATANKAAGSLKIDATSPAQSFLTSATSLYLSHVPRTDTFPVSLETSFPVQNRLASSDSSTPSEISTESIDLSTRRFPVSFSRHTEISFVPSSRISDTIDSRSYSYPSLSLYSTLLTSPSSSLSRVSDIIALGSLSHSLSILFPPSLSSLLSATTSSSLSPASTFHEQFQSTSPLDTRIVPEVTFQISASTINSHEYSDATDSTTQNTYLNLRTSVLTTVVLTLSSDATSLQTLTHPDTVSVISDSKSVARVSTVDNFSPSIHVSATPTPSVGFTTRALSDSTLHVLNEDQTSKSVTVSAMSSTTPGSTDGTETETHNPLISSIPMSSNGISAPTSESGQITASSSSPWIVTSSQTQPDTTTEETAGGADNQSGSDSGGSNVGMIAGGAAAAVAVLGALVGAAIYFKVKAASAVGSVPGAASYNSPSVPNQAGYNDPPRQPDSNQNRNNSNNTNGPNADRGVQDGPRNSKVKLPKNIKPSQISPMQNPPQAPTQPSNAPLPSISGQFPGGDASVPAMGSYDAPSVPGAANYSNPLASLHGPLPGGGSGVPGSGSYITPSIPGPANY